MEEGAEVVEPEARGPEENNDNTSNENNSEVSKGESEAGTANEEEQPKAKISGAARRRYRILLAHGIGEEEAKERAITRRMLTCEEKRQHHKNRNRSLNVKFQNNFPNLHARRLYVEAHYDKGFEDHPQTPKGAKFISLCHEYFPNVFLTRKHMSAIKKCLSRIYCTAPNTIRLYEVSIDLGWMRVSYADEKSRNWLNETIDRMEPLNGVKLKMIEDKEFPKLRIVFFEANTKYKSNTEVLKTLKTSNQDLNLNSWRVLERHDKNNLSFFVFTMNASSFEALKNAKFVIRYNTGTYTVRTFNEVCDYAEEARRREMEQQYRQPRQEYDEAFFIGNDMAARRFGGRSNDYFGYPIYDDDRY